ncbi:EAL domain-containing protein [Marinobacter salinisoli]|uniref:EAL domain-containing protein n=1 Tax=Marinobacter salinisoli TaxID=2769486 RepID=A0ABX7MWK8_9GAMM|nr:EAL domain-containing protein [Marinobacter salinisoli]QSP95486.1 EAL domain-containing protein [Marinobacter salinisoli]
MTVPSILRFVLLILSVLVCNPVLAGTDPVPVSSDSAIQPHFEVWQDPAGHADLDQVMTLADDQWQAVPNGSDTFGITRSAYWLRFAVHNQTRETMNLVAELGYSQLDDVIFHEVSSAGPGRVVRTGDTRPFYPREIDHPNMLFRFTLAPEQTKTLYVRVQTEGSLVLPLDIWHEHDFFGSASGEQKLHFFYYGCLFVIILINLAVFLTLRETLYLYYAMAITGYLLFFASIKGFSFQLLYPQFPGLHARVLLSSMPILALFSILFCREFLRVKSHSPRLDLALRLMIGFEVCNLVAALVLDYNTAIQLSSFSALFFFLLLLVAGPVSWAAGVRSGIFFTVAWTPLTLGVLATAGRALGFLPETFLTEYAMQIGSCLEAIILTFALADRLYHERQERFEAQADSLLKEKVRNRTQQRLTEAMTHDPVTGLPNRNRFERMTNRVLSQNPDGEYIVGIARITRMDEIHRTLGLARSERLLKSLAQQMTELAKEMPMVHCRDDEQGRSECVFQLSGDCLGLLIDVRAVDDKFEGMNKAIKLLSEPLPIDHLAIELHPKFGAAYYPQHGDSAALLIRNAHVGMENASQGVLATGVYSHELDIYSESRLTLMSDLKEALIQEQTSLHYQPKLCLKTGRVVGVEALIRWHHPERGWVFPSDFIPLAEETGVITQLTRWAVERGTADLATLTGDYPDLELSINISARDLSAKGLVEWIQAALQRHNLRPEQLTLELTETAAMEDPETGLKALVALADTGLRISVDDFGTGYSSLSYLKQLPASEIKLDRALIIDILDSESSRVIVETAVNMVHGLGYQVIAEGVEDEEAAQLLRDMNCDRLQGYWLSKPMPLNDVRRWMAQHNSAAIGFAELEADEA